MVNLELYRVFYAVAKCGSLTKASEELFISQPAVSQAIKQWEATIPYIENKALDDWTHNKSIQKACESFRITKEQKEYLKKLKVAKR